MKKMFILLLAAGLPLNSFAKPVTEKQLATYFIDNVKTSADKNIDLGKVRISGEILLG